MHIGLGHKKYLGHKGTITKISSLFTEQILENRSSMILKASAQLLSHSKIISYWLSGSMDAHIFWFCTFPGKQVLTVWAINQPVHAEAWPDSEHQCSSTKISYGSWCARHFQKMLKAISNGCPSNVIGPWPSFSFEFRMENLFLTTFYLKGYTLKQGP